MEYSLRHFLKAELEKLNVAVAVLVEMGLQVGLEMGSLLGLTASVSVRMESRGEKVGGWTIH